MINAIKAAVIIKISTIRRKASHRSAFSSALLFLFMRVGLAQIYRGYSQAEVPIK